MSALPVSAPIQRLDFDILWCIIMINADIFSNNRALETTLATSRVCRDWRNFMLNTSSIWAHLMDFGGRHWWTVEGRHELIRRNGTAMLWMKVPDLDGFTLRGAKVILSVVSENLQRIQKLEVTIGYGHVDQWELLYHPAPLIESFGITFEHGYDTFKHMFPSLFGGSAPMLRELRFNGHSSYFAARPSWLHQLRSLDLSVKLTVSEMLGVLILTEKLANLRLDHILADHATSILPLVSLPKLVHLDFNLYGEVTAGAVLLDHLRIPSTCLLTISARSIQRRDVARKSPFAHIMRIISTRARPNLAHHMPQQLDLVIKQRRFLLQTATCSNKPTFRFYLKLAPRQVFPKYALAVLLSEFSLPYFSKVISFHFKVRGVNRPVPEIPTFVECLPAVNAIMTEKWSLRHLIRAQVALKTADKIAFPMLKVLNLRCLLSSRTDTSQFDSSPDPVSKFVMARIAHDHAISIIDLTEDTLDVLPDMAFLGKAVGLEVHWRQRGVADICNYICGMGIAQKVESV